MQNFNHIKALDERSRGSPELLGLIPLVIINFHTKFHSDPASNYYNLLWPKINDKANNIYHSNNIKHLK